MRRPIKFGFVLGCLFASVGNMIGRLATGREITELMPVWVWPACVLMYGAVAIAMMAGWDDDDDHDEEQTS